MFVFLLDLTLLPLSLVYSCVAPTILALSMLKSALILPVVCIKKLICFIVPRTFTSSVHLTVSPAAFVLVTDSDKSAKALYSIIFESPFISNSIRIHYFAFSMPHIIVKLAYIVTAIFISSFAFALKVSISPYAAILAFGLSSLKHSLALRFVIMPLSLVAITVSRNESAASLSLTVQDGALV